MHWDLFEIYSTVAQDHSIARLSKAEKLRAASIQRPQRRLQFIAGRLLARQLLQKYCGNTDWSLTAKQGEPVHIAGHPELHISISHSGKWVACALADFCIGIDIETIKPSRPARDMAELACSYQEFRTIEQLPTDSDRLKKFLQFWTMKEAWLKQYAAPLTFEQMRALNAIPNPADTANAATWIDHDRNVVIALAAPQGKISSNTHGNNFPPDYWFISNKLQLSLSTIP